VPSNRSQLEMEPPGTLGPKKLLPLLPQLPAVTALPTTSATAIGIINTKMRCRILRSFPHGEAAPTISM
jgi:hypothetical protein